MEPAVLFALIGVLGIGSQWLAWRLRLPAIVLMLLAGILAGPVTGLIHPQENFGELFRPIVSVAVAVILFEGGLTLNFRGLRDARPGVRRLVFLGAPLGWILSTLAVRYGAGLSWESSLVFGGILVVTGPTVIMPLLRQARLASRPASLLRWESIVNDPVGALLAVLSFEVITALYSSLTLAEAIKHLILGIVLASVVGYAAGAAIAYAFRRGKVPEYMKVPVLFGALLAVYASTDSVLHESGLLAVTIMGVYLANAHLPSFDELRRFKEHVTVILVSGVFILLAASLNVEMLAQLDARAILFVLAVIFLARPLAVMISLAFTGLPWREKAIVAWIGPRGVVAVAVSGLFGARLVELGIEDGALLAPLAFLLVAVTVVVHGFSLGPVARLLGLTSTEPPGVLIVGGSKWSTDFATDLQEAGIRVLIAEKNYHRLRAPRAAGVATYHGEILSEAAEHRIDLEEYGTLIAATDNDAYNALICTDFGPEFGRSNVFQIGRHASDVDSETSLPITLGGRPFGSGLPYEHFSQNAYQNHEFRLTRLSDEYSLEQYLEERPEAEILAKITEKGVITIRTGETYPPISDGDRVLAFAPSRKPV